MANLTKSLTMPNGQEYEFVGKQWYGVCTTAASTAAKTVSITGFTSSDLVAGVHVTVQFRYYQYASAPTLNVSSTGAKQIRILDYSGTGETAAVYEWQNGEIIDFVYDGTYWVIENGGHASATAWGKTKLTSVISGAVNVALNPYAVYNAGYITSASLPTKVSDLTNDSGYLTLATLPVWDGSVT